MKLKSKTLIFLFALLLPISQTFAQGGQMDQKDLAYLKKATMYFVIDGEDSSLYNKGIIAAAQKYWTFTKYDFIKYSEIEEYAKKPNSSFFLKLTFGVNTGVSGGQYAYKFNPNSGKYENTFVNSAPGLSYRYDGIVIVNGNRSNVKFAWRDWLAYALVDNVLEEKDFHFRMGNYVQMLQKTLEYFDKSGDKNLTLSKCKKLYNPNLSQLKDKILYIRKNDLGPKINFQKVKGAYKYKYKLVGDAEIAKAIEEQDPNVVLLNHVTTANRYYPYLTLAKGGDIIYMDMQKNYLVYPERYFRKFLEQISE